MASEWEELEKLTKEELIIELVRERSIRREINHTLRSIVDLDYPVDGEPPLIYESADCIREGAPTTDEWARRIALYAKEHHKDIEFAYTDISKYGLDMDQADRIFDSLAEEGILDWDSSDPRSSRFSGVCGLYTDELEALEPEERERRLQEEREFMGKGDTSDE